MFGADCTKNSNVLPNSHHSGDSKGAVTAVCTQRVVMHLDMDCFFVSAILRSDGMKHLRNEPVAVAHSADTPYTNTSVTSPSGAYTAGVSHISGPTYTATGSSNPRPLHSSTSSSSSSSASFSPTTTATAISADDVTSIRQTKGNTTVPTPNFSSSSEISSCNYPARESGRTRTIDSNVVLVQSN